MSDSSPYSTPNHSEDEQGTRHRVRTTNLGNNLESEPDGEDLIENAENDYRAIPQLDTYEQAGLDQDDYESMTAEERLNAELEIRRRNALSRGALDLDWDSDDEMAILDRRNRLRRQRTEDADPIGELLQTDTENPIILQEVTGPLKDYLERPEIRKEIARRFNNFLINFKGPDDEPIYLNKIKQMAAQNLESLEVSYPDISAHTPIIGIWLGDAPSQILEILNDAAYLLITNQALFPEFTRIASEIHVRITDLPIIDRIRDLRQMHLNGLIRTRGVVTKRTSVLPQLRLIKWKCKCGETIGPFPVSEEKPTPPTFCPNCDGKSGFIIDSSSTIYRNFQRLSVQEPPGDVDAGRLPRTKEVILLGDLTDICRPGEEIEITGIYKHVLEVRRSGPPVFNTMIEANHIRKSGDSFSAVSITEEEKRLIIEKSRDPNIREIVFDSIAPSIFGHRDIKAAIALSLFGGTRKVVKGRHTLRGDINVLIMGDPGTAKSQFLKYSESIAPRAVFTTGKGASAVGLTASVHKDPTSHEWTLEGGALVLADGGVCLIDEFDKMTDKDRVSIHEAMEQQTISISKAGINAELQARCSVIAACNPIRGRYDASLSFLQNSGLTDPILSRFDVLLVVRDIPDIIYDTRLAEAVVKSHQGEDMTQSDDLLPQPLLRKYIAYARQNCHPCIVDIDDQKLASLYTSLRSESGREGGLIGIRHFESIIRLAEAHARLHLRNNVLDQDINLAISLILDSFISTQKYSNKKELEKRFSKYLVHGRDRVDLLMHVAHSMVRERLAFARIRRATIEEKVRIKKSDFEARARDIGVTDFSVFYKAQRFLNEFKDEGSEIVCLN